MPVKSLSKTHKKRVSNNPLKTSTAKRSKKMSRKAGKKRGGAKTKKRSPSSEKEGKTPSPESSDKQAGDYEMPEDLPLPEEYTNERSNQDKDFVYNAIQEFYDTHAAIKKLKKKPTNTKKERLDKKTILAKAPSLIPFISNKLLYTAYTELVCIFNI